MTFYKRGLQLGLLVLLLLTAGQRTVRAQDPDIDAVLTEVRGAISRGDLPVLLDHAADRVEIALFGESKRYSKAQARYVLQDFFNTYRPRRFVFRDHSQTDRGWFAEGEFWYGRADRPLRLYVLLRLRDHRWELREIIIEERTRR